MLPSRSTLLVSLTVFASGLLACRDARAPEPAPAADTQPAPPIAAGPQVLTSRDTLGAPAPSAAAPLESPLPPGHPPIGGDAAPHGASSASAKVAGTIDAAPAVKGKIKGGTLFVIARNAGSRQVVAVQREDSLDFPVAFELTSANVMMQGAAFEGPFDVTARWSKSGDAMPGAGDIEGTTRGVAVGAAGVKITLSDVRP